MALRGCLMLCSVLFAGLPAWAKVLNVPAEYPSIGAATDAAEESDEVVVAPGVYNEQLNFGYRDIVVRSQFNGDWAVVRNTIIEAGSNGPSVVIYGGTEKCILRGFTICNSSGAIRGSNTYATIEYNIITRNFTRYNTNIENCDGLIQNNIVEGNTASLGAAFSRCDGVIQNNLVRNNLAIGFESPGHNIPAAGGAFYQCRGTIRNNTVVDNFIGNEWEPNKPKRPGGFKDCTAVITNNIVYHTTMTTPLEYEGSSIPTYCLFRDARPGQGNLASDPRFINPTAGDFRLRPDSPCLDAGCAAPGLTRDIFSRPRPFRYLSSPRGDGSAIDLGALEAFYPNAARPALWHGYD